MSKNTLAKPFTIAGFVLGEIYMLCTVLAPNLKGAPVPLEATIHRILALTPFFGVFGGAVGLGIWLLFLAVKQSLGKSQEPREDEPPAPAPPAQGASSGDPGTR